MSPSAAHRVWQRLVHTDPSTLDDEPGRWTSIWEPGQALAHELEALPEGLLDFWLRDNRGHVLIGSRPTAFLPGTQQWQGRSYTDLCLLHSADIEPGNTRLWRALLTLFDSLLGGDAPFSAGSGATPRLCEAAMRFQRAAELGYALEVIEAKQGDRAAYLVGTWRLYLSDPARLNAVDPLAHRLFADSLMNEAFWRRVLSELG